MSIRPLLLLPALLALAALPLLAQDAPAGAASATIELAFLNGDYTNLDPGLTPIESGVLTITLSSPEHRVTVYGNRLAFTARPDGTLAASLEVELEGEGRIIADLSGGGIGNRFEDRVKAPRQKVVVAGAARLERVPEGYRLTVVEAPPAVDIEVESGVATRIVAACQALAKIPFVPVRCGGLEAALRVVTVPLPQPGETFVLPDERLTEAEKAFFERLVR